MSAAWREVVLRACVVGAGGRGGRGVKIEFTATYPSTEKNVFPLPCATAVSSDVLHHDPGESFTAVGW